MYLPPDQYISQFASDRRPLILWAVVTASALLWLALIAGTPLARANGLELFSLPLYQAFSYVCHQAPERSFFVSGHPLAVCARCTGLYFGFAAAVVFYPLVTSLRRTQTPDRKWLLIAATPLAIDFGLGLFGIWENTHSSRFLTAALLGIVSVFYILPGLVEVLRRSQSRQSSKSERTAPLNRRTAQVNRRTEQTAPGASAHHPDAAPVSIPQASITAPSDYSSPHRRI